MSKNCCIAVWRLQRARNIQMSVEAAYSLAKVARLQSLTNRAL